MERSKTRGPVNLKIQLRYSLIKNLKYFTFNALNTTIEKLLGAMIVTSVVGRLALILPVFYQHQLTKIAEEQALNKVK